MRNSRTNFALGFTLLELVMVMVLIAFITALAVPSMSNFAQSRSVNDTSDQIVALAHYARTQSIARGIAYRLNFDSGKNMYWLTMQNGTSFENQLQDDASVTPNLTSFSALGSQTGGQFTAPAGMTITCTALPQPDGQYVEFHPTGRCDPAIVHMTDSHGKLIDVGALSATESWHVLSDDERQQEQSLSAAPPAIVR